MYTHPIISAALDLSNTNIDNNNNNSNGNNNNNNNSGNDNSNRIHNTMNNNEVIDQPQRDMRDGDIDLVNSSMQQQDMSPFRSTSATTVSRPSPSPSPSPSLTMIPPPQTTTTTNEAMEEEMDTRYMMVDDNGNGLPDRGERSAVFGIALGGDGSMVVDFQDMRSNRNNRIRTSGGGISNGGVSGGRVRGSQVLARNVVRAAPRTSSRRRLERDRGYRPFSARYGREMNRSNSGGGLRGSNHDEDIDENDDDDGDDDEEMLHEFRRELMRRRMNRPLMETQENQTSHPFQPFLFNGRTFSVPFVQDSQRNSNHANADSNHNSNSNTNAESRRSAYVAPRRSLVRLNEPSPELLQYLTSSRTWESERNETSSNFPGVHSITSMGPSADVQIRNSLQQHSILNSQAVNACPQFLVGCRVACNKTCHIDETMRHEILKNCKILGAEVYMGYSFEITHFLSPFQVGDEYERACSDRKIVVGLQWLEDCISAKRYIEPYKPIVHHSLKSWVGIPGMKGLVISVTGFIGDGRNDLKYLIRASGATYSGALQRKENTHLLCSMPEGEKYRKALEWKIKVVNARWIYDCVAQWVRLPEIMYQDIFVNR